MDDQSRAQLLSELDRGEAEFLAAIENTTPDEAAFRPSEASWTILECVEHSAATETLMLRRIKSQSEALDTPLLRPEFEVKLLRNVTGRGRKVEAPDAARPHGRFLTLADAAAHFRQIRSQTRDYVVSCDDDLRSRTIVHPFAGTLSCFEGILMIVAHPLRHSAQIQEIRELWIARAAE